MDEKIPESIDEWNTNTKKYSQRTKQSLQPITAFHSLHSSHASFIHIPS